MIQEVNERPNFVWEKYDEKFKGGNKLVINPHIDTEEKTKLYSREDYAKQFYDVVMGNKTSVIRKDLIKDDYVKITNVFNITEDTFTIELNGGVTIDVDLKREKKFLNTFGYTEPKELTTILSYDKKYLEDFLQQNILVQIVSDKPLKISLINGYLKKHKDEFLEQIKTPNKAYIAKVKQISKGGFFIDVMGVEGFMPGSLAAPNKIMDFQSYLGKNIIVMVEDYIKDINSFIFSHKKYVEFALPTKLQSLDLKTQYKGIVTGTSRHGIFIEFEDICTGLLHTSKMNSETLDKFNQNSYKPGDEIDIYIAEISKDNRIILTEENYDIRMSKLNEFVKQCKGNFLEATVLAVLNIGVIVSIGDYNGIIPIKEFNHKKIESRSLKYGDKIEVMFYDMNEENKLIFSLA